ncbi:MAG: ATP-dependent sacrificial sulfur transferase LarE [Syntrophobacteraceae bacterium]|nr:ATP-dependent sacrificial sulfur transferase LarE [Syntrophobacteraceae bacterium]
MVTIEKATDEKYSRLQEILTKMESVAVGFSGGVDSTLLVRVAQMVLGNDRVLAVTAASRTTPRHEKQATERLAAESGIGHLIIESDELEIPEFTKNSEDRCYICKKSRFAAITALAGQRGLNWTADGSNSDDRGDYRPGMKALLELGVRSPLLEAGLSKADIRTLSRRLGLSTWDKPASPCLATRIPYGTPITAEKLSQVEAAEDFILSKITSRQLRVRHHGKVAHIEIAAQDIPKLLEKEIREDVVGFLKGIGFKLVMLDLEGYRMGNLNPKAESETQEKGSEV